MFQVLNFFQVAGDGGGSAMRFLLTHLASVRLPGLTLEPMRFPFGEKVTTGEAITQDFNTLLSNQSGTITSEVIKAVTLHTVKIPKKRRPLPVYKPRALDAGRLKVRCDADDDSRSTCVKTIVY